MVRSILWSGTVPPLVSPVYGACDSPRLEGVRQFGNPPCEPGCWAFDEAVGSSLWFQWPPRSESYFVARRSYFASKPRCSVVRMREAPDPFLPPFEILWRLRRSNRSLREHHYQAAAAWQVPSPASAWKDASRSENDVRSAVPVGGYVKITLLSWLWEMTANRLFLWRPEGSSVEVRLLHKNLLA